MNVLLRKEAQNNEKSAFKIQLKKLFLSPLISNQLWQRIRKEDINQRKKRL